MTAIFSDIARSVNISDAVFRLVFSLLLNYPLACFYRAFLHHRTTSTKHAFIIASGVMLAYFNYGLKIIHSLATVLVNYLLLVTIGGSRLSVLILFIFNLGYLLLAYWAVYSDSHDTSWATPQCVLTLKMIGTAFDLYDGHRSSKETLSEEQKALKLDTAPSLLELAGFTYYSCGFFVGPQFSMKRYQDFVSRRVDSSASPLVPGLKRLSFGIVYCLLLLYVSPIYNSKYLLTKDFLESSFVVQLFVLCVWGEFIRWKYVAVWLIAEGSCIMTGLAYSGEDEQGRPQWDGCCNVRLYDFEMMTEFKDIVKSFNCNTNLWFSRYIYKRLKFLGNRWVSMALSMVFISVWHGLYLGYYSCFFLEMAFVLVYNQVEEIVYNSPFASFFSHPAMRIPVGIIKKFAIVLGMGYALAGFVYLHSEPLRVIYSSTYYFGHVLFLVITAVNQLILKPLRRPNVLIQNGKVKAN